MKQRQEIIRELRELRKLTHSIDVALKVKENHEKRREYLISRGITENSLAEIRKIDDILRSLQIDDSIKRASTLELKYMTAIGKLERIDRTIILDGYINGKPYWKIGRDIGYTEDGIKKRMSKIIERIAELI